MSKSAFQVAVLIDAGFFLHETHTPRAQQSLHGRLEVAPHVAFRKGRLVFEGWTIPRTKLRDLVRANRPVCADDFQPEFTQKGVGPFRAASDLRRRNYHIYGTCVTGLPGRIR